jgi:predicted enzyme related to lactoylglutathione lyase
MPDKTDYTPGTPCWVDLATPDVAAAGRFYGKLFGWEIAPVEDKDAGGYTMLKRNGKEVAALGPKQDEHQPTAWTSYVSVEDADKTAELAQSAGGTVLLPAFDVFDAGRMAIIADPTGGAIALWQPRQMHGAELVEEPHTFGWTELNTRDTKKAEKFYADVFGWSSKTSDAGGMAYTEFKVGDASVAGMMAMSPGVPAAVPSYWMPYFHVEDIDKAFADATKLGAETVMPVGEAPNLRYAIVKDPQGAIFGLLQAKE